MASVDQLFSSPEATIEFVYNLLPPHVNKEVTTMFNLIDVNTWRCTYLIKWPFPKSFDGLGFTREEASEKASLRLLSWLVINGSVIRDESSIVPNPKTFKLYYTSTIGQQTTNNNMEVDDVVTRRDCPSNNNNLTLVDNKNQEVVKKKKRVHFDTYGLGVDNSPKGLLYNILHHVATQLNNSNIKPLPTFHVTEANLWCCTYNLIWPSSSSFQAVDASKKLASHNAALLALDWLKQNGSVNKEWQPIIKPLNFQDTYEKVELAKNCILPFAGMFGPQPRIQLISVYQTVAKQLCNVEFQLSFERVAIDKKTSAWKCRYRVNWPKPLNFESLGSTKKEATYNASLGILVWLRNSGNLDQKGNPTIVGQMQTNTKLSILKLKGFVANEMAEIARLHAREIRNLNQNKESDNRATNQSIYLSEPGDVNFSRFKWKRSLSQRQYLLNNESHLPISEYKDEIISMVANNRICIIKGEPGCGKSTRVPQYLLESWARSGWDESEPCMIAVTQPRRIAAISLANRVAKERNEECGLVVGFQVRLNSKFNPLTGRVLYCTTGILLRYAQSDLSLCNFTHVILDEAHERDVNTDLLMNLMKRAMELNPRLKLIVMSATIDTDLFKRYFNDAPDLSIPGFTFHVESHYLQENSSSCPKTMKMCKEEFPSVIHEDVSKVINYIHRNKPAGAILCFLPGWEDIRKVSRLMQNSSDKLILPLHSKLDDADQWKIFAPAPPGVRKIILSTNIAETSVTIDDVVYVVDTGIFKEVRFDNVKGVKCVDNYWVSQASVIQRKGRAGRVRSGECFHVYPRSKFDSLQKFTDPQIKKTSLTKIVLDSKVFSNNMDAIEFMSQLPSPPERNATRRAVRELKDLELLDEDERLTPLGKTLAHFQLEPKLAKVLVNAVVYKCVTPVVDIVTLFSSDIELFRNVFSDKQGIQKTKRGGSKTSDHLAMMVVFENWLELLEEYDESSAREFCAGTNLVHHKLITVNKLREIHFNYLVNGLHDSLPISDNYSDNDELVKAVLLSGVGTLLKCQTQPVKPSKRGKKTKTVLLTNHNQKAILSPDSVNSGKNPLPSDYLVYFSEEMSEMRKISTIRESSVISPIPILLFAPQSLVVREIESDDLVSVSLEGTHVEFLCSYRDSQIIKNCKEALGSIHVYFLNKMTQGGECNPSICSVWDEILKHVSNVLMHFTMD